MKIIKKIVERIKHFNKPPKAPILFYTKDIFKGRKFLIGDYTYGNPRVLFENEDANLIIGKFCSIAYNVTIFLGGNHRTDWISTYPFNVLGNDFSKELDIKGHPATKGDVIIGNDVWIGINVIIMSGVTIGDGAVIAAGAVVSKNISDYEIWGGNPAILLKKRFNENDIVKLKEMKWWDWDIEKIKSEVGYLCSNKI
jgi:acetyltransferase-like isoleucine patch superfamily enzyme